MGNIHEVIKEIQLLSTRLILKSNHRDRYFFLKRLFFTVVFVSITNYSSLRWNLKLKTICLDHNIYCLNLASHTSHTLMCCRCDRVTFCTIFGRWKQWDMLFYFNINDVLPFPLSFVFVCLLLSLHITCTIMVMLELKECEMLGF